MLISIAIALAVVAFLLFVALSVVSGMLIRSQQEAGDLMEENSRLRFKLIDASVYLSRVLDPEIREEEE